jgi:ribosomal protein L19E
MLQWIDPDRPQELTSEQSRSVNQQPNVRELVSQQEVLKRDRTATSHPAYKKLNSEIIGERR